MDQRIYTADIYRGDRATVHLMRNEIANTWAVYVTPAKGREKKYIIKNEMQARAAYAVAVSGAGDGV